MENGQVGRKMDMDNIFLLMVIFMKDTSKMDSDKVMAHIHGQINLSIKENGIKIGWTAKAYTKLLMVNKLKGILKMITLSDIYETIQFFILK